MSELVLQSTVAARQRLTQRYQIISLLGQHAWSRTYVALDTHRPHQPQCVVREYFRSDKHPPSASSGYGAKARWRGWGSLHGNALQTLIEYAQVEHDQIASLRDQFELFPILYVVRDYIPGYSLAQIHSKERWRDVEVLHLLSDVLPVLQCIHDQHQTHGNLHPGNIILRRTDGKTVLTDLRASPPIVPHIVQERWANAPDIRITDIMATQQTRLAYLAPEQLQGQVSPSSDLYSLGMVAIELLTGIKPWQYPTDPATGKLLWQSPQPIRPPLRNLISRLIAPTLPERFGSASEVLQAIQTNFGADFRTGRSTADGADWDIHPIANAASDAPLDSSDGAELVPSEENEDQQLPESPPVVAYHRSSWLSGPVVFASILLTVAIAACGYFWLLHPEYLDRLLDPEANRLAKAKEEYQQGNVQVAIQLAQDVAPGSKVYEEAQRAIARWQQEQAQAEWLLPQIDAAHTTQTWDRVLQLIAQMPQTDYWQAHFADLQVEAQTNLDRQGESLLSQAFDRALERDFVTALEYLDQISPRSVVYDRVPAKVAEYTQKRDVRALYYLQEAFNAAENQDFDAALANLAQIHPATPVYPLAQDKLAEYLEKQQIRAQYLLIRAENRATLEDFTGAILLLQQVAPDTSAYDAAQAKILEYGEAQRRQATATGTPDTIPLPLWDVSSVMPSQPIPVQPLPETSADQLEDIPPDKPGLNPGDRLQEISPF
jgi:serine/threonine protein kinase